MSTDLGPEFMEKYNVILNKLKKRFMRKPNVSEAVEELCAMAQEAELAEQPSHAGFCYLGAAKFADCAGNTTREAEYLLMSARQFIKAELKLSCLKCISPGRENLEAAISCYSHASLRYPEGTPLRASVFLELADNLQRLGYLSEAINYYQSAIDNQEDNHGNVLACLDKIASIQLKQNDYQNALNTFNKIDELSSKHVNKSQMQRCEINRFLLYLIVQPSPKLSVPSIDKLIDRYSLENFDPEDDTALEESQLHPELFLNLQSVLAACKTNDVQTLVNLQSEMNTFLDVEQQDLMRTVIKIYNNMM